MNVFRGLARDSLLSAIVHVAPRVANVVIFILIGRLAGPDLAGVFALGTTYLIIATTIMRGMDDLIIRQIAREPNQAQHYLTSFLFFRFGLAIVLYAIVLGIVQVLDYAESTRMIILIITLSLIPDSISYISQAILLGKRQFIAPAIAMSTATLFKVFAAIFSIYNHDLVMTAWYWLIGSILGMVIALWLAIRSIGGIPKSLNWLPLVNNWSSVWVFLSITVLATLESQSDVIILSTIRGESDVGWYNAATTIAFTLSIISQAFRLSIYPLMTSYSLNAPEKLQKLYHQSLRYLALISFPMVTGIFVLADPIVHLIYKDQFNPTIQAVQLLIPIVALMFLNVPSARMMLVYDQQKRSALFITISAALNISLNLILDQQFGASGAATARLFSTLTLFLLIYLYTKRTLIQSHLLAILLKPFIISIFMGLTVFSVRSRPLFISIPIGIFVYMVGLWIFKEITPNDITIFKSIFAKQSSHHSKS